MIFGLVSHTYQFDSNGVAIGGKALPRWFLAFPLVFFCRVVFFIQLRFFRRAAFFLRAAAPEWPYMVCCLMFYGLFWGAGCFSLPNRRRNTSRLTSKNTGNDSKNAQNPCPTLHTLNDTGITLLSAAIR
mgnify:CR=1 FL=1